MDRFEYLSAALRSFGIHFEESDSVEGVRAAIATMTSLHTRFQLIATFEGGLLSLYCVSSCRVPEGAQREAVVLANRVNAGLRLGAFCLDHDIDLVFKASSFAAEDTIQLTLGHLLMGCSVVLDTFVPAFNSLIYANTPANEAFENATR